MTKKITFLILLVLIFVVVSGCSQEKTLSLEDEFKETTSNEFIFDKPGIYGDTDIRKEFKGTIYIKTDGVTLQNVNITGDLIITEEVAEGYVELIDLNISNTVYVYGGGENSIRFRRTKSKHTLVYKPRKPVRIVIDKESKIDAITVQSSAILEGDSFSSVSIKPKEENIDINLIGIFKKIEIKGQTHIATSEKTYIENIVINEQAKKTIITGDGNILNMEVNAENINIDIPVDNVYTNNNINKVVINNKETNLIIEPEEIYHTADTWEIGMPWDPEWGEEPDYLDIPENEPEIVNFEYNICKYIATSNPNTLEITVSLTKPGTVYYVFEDISTMFGSEYLPSIEQVIQGNNALGNPNPKIEPNTGDDNFEFFTEAFIHGQFVITEANKEYMIVIEGPTFAEMKEETFIEAPSGFKGSIVAIDENGNKIIK